VALICSSQFFGKIGTIRSAIFLIATQKSAGVCGANSRFLLRFKRVFRFALAISCDFLRFFAL
jgi:hypothetical protein